MVAYQDQIGVCRDSVPSYTYNQLVLQTLQSQCFVVCFRNLLKRHGFSREYLIVLRATTNVNVEENW